MQKLTPVQVLRQLSFGERVAEEEVDQLANYFVETDNWNQVFEGNADLIYGAKGSGKSAIYNLLLSKMGRDSLFDRKILTAAGENPQGAPAFAMLHDERAKTEADFVYIWKLYILSICVNCMRDFELASSSEAKKVVAILEGAGLVSREFHLRKLLTGILEYLQKISIESEISLDPSGAPSVKTKLSASDGEKVDIKQRAKLGNDLDNLFDLIDRALAREGYSIWILLDRLDVAFSEKDQLERNALRALFRCYRDLRGHRHIGLKIFLRDDIWERITMGGMTEASHFVRKVTLAWSRDMLLNLVVKRIVASKSVCQFMKVDNNQVLSDLGMQEGFFYEVFPKTIGGKRASFDWILERTSDATKKAMPREVIHFFNELRSAEIKRLMIGVKLSSRDGQLFSDDAFKEALPPVSKARLEQTIYAEYPDKKNLIERLRNRPANLDIRTLRSIWGKTTEQVLEAVDQLKDIGFLEVRGSGRDFRIPYLYRPALGLEGSTYE